MESVENRTDGVPERALLAIPECEQVSHYYLVYVFF